ncbi:MAG: Amidohydrolase [Planctomycetes bacterium ADurb.Bin126]|nr:MAG: Amidohydrolase [Planctomycetes bacterium ADurb.Bin126]HOD83704.1 amidohydrolase family protein [Phycisphaerae bacterium]HQL71698.1 amidohydrolase family protein [Phycisphaerae bacterium]
MIVDCLTHIWSNPDQLGQGARAYIARQGGREDLSADAHSHEQASRCVWKALVMGFCSVRLGAEVPNELIAEHVSRNSDRMIGIAAVDPAQDEAVKVAEELLERREFRGLTVSPCSQDFHPSDSRAMALYELAQERGAPIFFCQGTHFQAQACLDYARPFLLDEVAREFPRLTIVISSLGHPWVEEGIALVGKHPRVFADVASLLRRPWQAYNALVLAYQYRVMDKILFGSDFPYFTAAEAIEGLYRLHEVVQGTNLPPVPRETLRSVVERDALAALGIARASDAAAARRTDSEPLFRT